MGSWRDILETYLLMLTNKNYKNKHKDYHASWWKDIPEEHLTKKWEDYDVSINKYGVKVSTTLQFWECKIGYLRKIHMDGSNNASYYNDFNGQMMNDKLNVGYKLLVLEAVFVVH